MQALPPARPRHLPAGQRHLLERRGRRGVPPLPKRRGGGGVCKVQGHPGFKKLISPGLKIPSVSLGRD